MLATRKQIRDSVLATTKQNAAQIGDLVEDLINVTIQEIGSPAWAFRTEKYHLWSWLKRKTSFTATSEDTILERDVDKIAFLRQTDSPVKIDYMKDEDFYRALPNPTETGNPIIYRLWEIEGTSTALAAAATLKAISSSASDNSSYYCVVTGYISGRLESEVITMNGTTSVAGTKTFDARELYISKSAIFNGNLTISDASDNSLVIIGAEEISPRFKVVSLWPTPSSTEVYMEYYKKIKELNSDHEVPEFDPKWHHIVRTGTLAKVYEYLGMESAKISVAAWYQKQVRAMVTDDSVNPDLIDHLRKRDTRMQSGVRLTISQDTIS